MFRSGVVLKLALIAALALPATLYAQTTHWYQPHYLPGLQDAVNQLQTLSPHFAPVSVQDNSWSLTNDYALARVEVDKVGIKLYFSKSPAQQIQFVTNWNGGSPVPAYSPYTGDILTNIVFGHADYFLILNFPQAGPNFPAPWCVALYGNNPDGNNSILCVSSQAEAQGLVDALATLVVGSGGDLSTNDGIDGVVALPEKFVRKHPTETGGLVTNLEQGSPAAQAGIQIDDVLHAVNGKPYVVNQGMIGSAVREATLRKPEGGDVHFDIFRKDSPLAIDVHFPGAQVNAEVLRRQSLQSAEAGGAPPQGIHFGFQVRPVIADDLAPLGLTQAKGIVVVSVLNGSLADAMGVLPGDVILQVNGADVGELQHFVQTLHSAAVSTFSVWRKGKTLVLTVPQSM